MATKKKRQERQPGLFGATGLSPWRRERREASLARQLEMIARIHSAEVKSLTLTKHLRSPGATADGEIHLNPDSLPAPVGRNAIATWIGVTMHEVGHCQWSPQVIPHADQGTYNLLEDSRQEALLIEKLPGTVAPLTRAVADLIVHQVPMASPAQVWPLVAGRVYLPEKLRRKVYDGTVAEMGQEWADEVRQVVLDYCKLMDPGFSEVQDAQRLIARMNELLGQMPKDVIVVCYSHGTDSPEVDAPTIPVDPVGSGDSEDDGGEGEGEGGGEQGEDGGVGQPGSDSGGSDSGKTEGKTDSSKDDRQSGKSDGSQEADESEAAPGGSGAGTGNASQNARSAARDLKAAAREVSREAAEGMSKIIDTVMDRAMSDEFAASKLDKTDQTPLPVSREARMVVARLMSALKPLTDQAEAGLDKMTASGRLRPDRIDRGYRPDHVFDKWQLDLHDAVSAEIVVAVDVSGSMASYNAQLTEAVWVMRQVAARTAAKLTVLAWDNKVEVVTSPLRNDVAWSPYRGGGTSGAPMIRIAIDILAQSRENRKWLLVMTDGDVSDVDATKKEVLRLKAECPDVAVTPIGFGYNSKPQVFGDNAQKISDLMDIPKVVGAMLYDLYRKNIVR